MHANVQTRFNPATGDMAPYYRIKESYRDVQGHVHSLILLNIGFEPSLTAVQVRKIAYALTKRFKNRSVPSLFKEHLDGLTPIEQARLTNGGAVWSKKVESIGLTRKSRSR